jgi:hypothetical protein
MLLRKSRKCMLMNASGMILHEGELHALATSLPYSISVKTQGLGVE